MKRLSFAAAVLTAAMLFAGGPANATNICQAQQLSCATTMPVDGYCECTTHGKTQSGTVVASSDQHSKLNATAGGCGAHPNATGCQ